MKKKYLILLVVLVFINGKIFAQDSKLLEIDQSAFTMIPDTNAQKGLLKSLTGFLAEKNKGSMNNSHIDPEYLKTNIEPFQHIQDIEMNGGMPFFFPTLLKAIPVEDGSVLLKIAYMGVGRAKSVPYLRIIATLVAKKKNDTYYFYNALDHYTRNWAKSQVGSIRYIYPNKLNLKKAHAMHQFNVAFAKKLNTKVLNVNYYKFEDPEQMFKTMGYDFIENMYNSRVGGLAQYWNNTVFAGNNSESYEHEVVHFYTYIVFPKGKKNVHEGYATYVGGSEGLTLDQLVPLAKNYIDKHPEQDITELATDFYPHTPEVQLTYVLSAIVCRDIETRYGMEGTKKLFNPADGDDYFMHLKKIIGIDKSDFPDYIKRLLDNPLRN